MSKVLVVDNTKITNVTLKKILNDNGYSVVGDAVTKEDAIKKYKSLKPDIVTLDINGNSEENIVQTVKEFIRNDRNAKVVVVSSNGGENLISKAIIAGAKTFLTKPFREELVISTLKKL